MDAALWGFLGTLVGGGFTMLGAILTNRSRAKEVDAQIETERRRMELEQQHADDVALREYRKELVQTWRSGIATALHASEKLDTANALDAPLPDRLKLTTESDALAQEWFHRLVPHLPADNDYHTYVVLTVSRELSQELSRQITDIERRWGLV